MILHATTSLPQYPKRIISLVPSQTELLYYLGLEKETVGITKFCIHPSNLHTSKTHIGGTKTINMDTIKGLAPDLIIANKEENVKEQIEKLAIHFPVLLTDVISLNDSLQMIKSIGDITGKQAKAIELVDAISESFKNLSHTVAVKNNYRVAYLIWRKPYMAAANETFINDMLCRCGFINVFDNQERYPEITVEEIKAANPQFLFLSSEPYPFNETHIAELKNHLPGTKILLVNGEFFSWYGSRLLVAADYFKQLVINTL